MADLRKIAIPQNITDISTAQTLILPITPHSEGQLMRVTTCIGGAISGADSLVVISKNGAVLSGGTITIANTSSAAGDIDYADFGNVFVKSGDYLTFAGGGESTGTATCGIIVDIAR